MSKSAPAQFEVHDLIRQRWSPRAFSGKPVSLEMMRSLFEAARWAPSCFNEQPWRFLVAVSTDQEQFDRLASCLNDSNRVWASRAGALVLSLASTSFARNGKANRFAWHDVGLATATLSLQATAKGLHLHQMAGFSSERARELYAVPEDYEPVAMLALGYLGDPQGLPDPLRERELAPRERKAQSEFVFAGRFGQALSEGSKP